MRRDLSTCRGQLNPHERTSTYVRTRSYLVCTCARDKIFSCILLSFGNLWKPLPVTTGCKEAPLRHIQSGWGVSICLVYFRLLPAVTTGSIRVSKCWVRGDRNSHTSLTKLITPCKQPNKIFTIYLFARILCDQNMFKDRKGRRQCCCILSSST